MPIKVKFSELPTNTKTPVLTYCRQLMKEGKHFNTKLEVYRENSEPDIIVRKIGKAARLTVCEDEERGPYFKRVSNTTTGSFSIDLNNKPVQRDQNE